MFIEKFSCKNIGSKAIFFLNLNKPDVCCPIITLALRRHYCKQKIAFKKHLDHKINLLKIETRVK